MNLKYDEINKTPFGIQEKQYEANSPTEDRLVVKELDHKEGYLLGVFDGHGGGHLVLISLLRHNKHPSEYTASSKRTMSSSKRILKTKNKPWKKH